MKHARRFAFSILTLVLVVTACTTTPPRPSAQPSAAIAGSGSGSGSVQQILLEDPAYSEVQHHATLEDQFQRYWAWLHELEIPDVAYLSALPTEDLERLAMVFHETIELRGWLRLGHRFPDIMNLDYYKQHYEEVYPVAHAAAMQAELGLLQRFAARVGIPRVPAHAFVLVGPMVERRGVTAAMADRRLRFNPDLAGELPTQAELDRAARVYEAGGYHYRDRKRVLDDAWAAVTERASAHHDVPKSPRP